MIVRPLDKSPAADATAVPPGHDVHRVDPEVAIFFIRVYIEADGGVGRLLMDPFKGFINGGYLSVVALIHRTLIVVVQVQHEEVVLLTYIKRCHQ